jgi:hypothetical protein
MLYTLTDDRNRAARNTTAGQLIQHFCFNTSFLGLAGLAASAAMDSSTVWILHGAIMWAWHIPVL